ncbi:hypothetical protein BDZ91DRAFT_737477 [Kalaharituber pfeilii]|nr:hypothetical protein BDZ91DRAFT_737477 [Kalaharituber pfeilii]
MAFPQRGTSDAHQPPSSNIATTSEPVRRNSFGRLLPRRLGTFRRTSLPDPTLPPSSPCAGPTTAHQQCVLTNYAYRADVEAVLRRKHGPEKILINGMEYVNWSIVEASTGYKQIWAPSILTEEEKKEIYSKTRGGRAMTGRKGIQWRPSQPPIH